MWRLATTAVLVSLSFAAQAQSLAALPQADVGPTSDAPGTGTSRGVNTSGTLNPQPPTGTVTALSASKMAVRPVPGEQPVGISVGGLTFFSSVTAATYFDDNVFALPSHPLGDWAFALRPELTWRSTNLGNIELGGNAYVEGRKYVTYDSEDQVNGGASIGGTAQIGADTQVVGHLDYVHGHEDRGVSDTITETFLRPISFDQGEASAALNHRWERVWTSIGIAGLVVHYDNAALDDGLIASQAYRSGDIEKLPFRIGYVLAPLTSIFVEVSGNRRAFDVDLYSSLGYKTVAGLLFEPGIGHRIRGEVYAGYMNQNYNGPTFRSVSTWTAGGSLAYLVTDNFTVSVEGRRDPREASLSGGVFQYEDGVSVIESVVSTRADYHLLPNMVVGAGVSYITDSYLSAARTDRALSPFASVKYFVAPKVTLGFEYHHADFTSSGLDIPGYRKNVYLLSLNARF